MPSRWYVRAVPRKLHALVALPGAFGAHKQGSDARLRAQGSRENQDFTALPSVK